MSREWITGGAAPGGVRSSPTNNQADADAEYILEEIMQRKNWGHFVRDELASYLKLIAKDAPRGGKLHASRRGRKNVK